jgi:hypothetical protein
LNDKYNDLEEVYYATEEELKKAEEEKDIDRIKTL